MKLIGILICIAGLTGGYASVYSQQTRLNLKVHDTTVKDVLKQIEEESEYSFMYNSSQIDVNRKVDLNIENGSLEEILKEIFSGENMSYKIIDRHIIISPGSKANGPVNVQPSKGVTGRITDSTGGALPGVTVVIKGTTMGTITDVDGKYTLQNVPANASLLFSFVGMKTMEQRVEGNAVINVVMEEESIGLQEVVAVGYGVQKKATLTGSIGTIKAEEMVQRPAANTTDLLQGQVAGLVTRQSSGLPGADGAVLRIRGFNEAPLIIVDGVYSSIDQVDPNDIESVSVLKDAAAAIYGARAGNGVILVTTKRGNEGMSQISYHGSLSVTQPTFLARQVNAWQYAEMLEESGLDPNNSVPPYVRYDPDHNTLTNLVDNSPYYGYDRAGALYRDWTPQQQHNISARGGNDKIKYFISSGFTGQESNFKSGDYDFSRYNIRANVDAKVTDNLSVSADFTYHTAVLDKANFTASDVFNNVNASPPTWPIVNEADPSRAATMAYAQTYKSFSGFIKNREDLLRGSMELRYDFPMIKGLSAKASLSFEKVFVWNKNVSKPFVIWEYDYLKAENGEDPWTKGTTKGTNTISVYSDRADKLLPLFSLEYEKTAGDHYFKGMLASESWMTEWTSLQGSRKDLLSYESPFMNYASQEGKDNAENTKLGGGSRPTKTGRSSFIGRINYEYAGKYLMEVAMRADASAEYPSKGRWGYFPSISAGWRISEEPFIKDHSSAVNNLKLRASYGILGNDAVSSFDYLTGFQVTDDFHVFGTTPAPVITPAGLANPDITWETMKISNIGLDGTFWDGKFGFELDAFYRLRDDILALPRTVAPSTYGADFPKTNLNKMDNRGFEISLSHKNKIGDFSYDISPMLSWTRGKYVKWDENPLPVTDDMSEEDRLFNEMWNDRNLRKGHWDDEKWGLVTDGFFMNQDEVDTWPIDQDQAGNQTLKVGDLKYKDQNGDNYIDWRDEKVIGKADLPKIMYSMNMGISYKGLSFRMLWQGAAAYSVTFTDRAAAPFHSGGIPLREHYKYRAIIDVDGEGKEFIANPDDFKLPPANQMGRNPNNTKASDFWIYDTRYLRLKNLNISYSLPKELFTRTGINECTVYFSGSNLFTISNLGIWKKSFDPEIPVANNRDYPPVKTMTLGLRLML